MTYRISNSFVVRPDRRQSMHNRVSIALVLLFLIAPVHTFADSVVSSKSGGLVSVLEFAGRNEAGTKITASVTIRNENQHEISIAAVPSYPRFIDNAGNAYVIDRFAGIPFCPTAWKGFTSSIEECIMNHRGRLPHSSYTILYPSDQITLSLSLVLDERNSKGIAEKGSIGSLSFNIGTFKGDPGDYKKFDQSNYRTIGVSLSRVKF